VNYHRLSAALEPDNLYYAGPRVNPPLRRAGITKSWGRPGVDRCGLPDGCTSAFADVNTGKICQLGKLWLVCYLGRIFVVWQRYRTESLP